MNRGKIEVFSGKKGTQQMINIRLGPYWDKKTQKGIFDFTPFITVIPRTVQFNQIAQSFSYKHISPVQKLNALPQHKEVCIQPLHLKKTPTYFASQ